MKDISPVANTLIEAIDNYMEQSNKTGYRYSEEEDIMINRKIDSLLRHIEMLYKYEISLRNSLSNNNNK